MWIWKDIQFWEGRPKVTSYGKVQWTTNLASLLMYWVGPYKIMVHKILTPIKTLISRKRNLSLMYIPTLSPFWQGHPKVTYHRTHQCPPTLLPSSVPRLPTSCTMGSVKISKTKPPKIFYGKKDQHKGSTNSEYEKIWRGSRSGEKLSGWKFWLGGQGTLDQVSEKVGEHKGVHSKEIEEKVKMPQK